MRFFVALLTLASLNSGFLLALPSFTLPPDDKQQTKSQGARGCPDPLGQLTLLSAKELRTQQQEPVLFFRLETDRPQTILITVNEADFRQSEPVFEQKLIAQGTGYLLIKMSGNLVDGKSYRLTAGILCRNSPEGATILSAELIKVSTPTPFDKLLASYYDAQTPQRIEPIRVEETHSSTSPL